MFYLDLKYELKAFADDKSMGESNTIVGVYCIGTYNSNALTHRNYLFQK